MRTVRRTEQLASIGIRPREPAADPVAVLAKQVSEATSAHEKMMVASTEALNRVALALASTQENPVAERPSRWIFTCEYDSEGKLTEIIAEAN